MVKDHTFGLLNFGTLPLVLFSTIYRVCSFEEYLVILSFMTMLAGVGAWVHTMMSLPPETGTNKLVGLALENIWTLGFDF